MDSVDDNSPGCNDYNDGPPLHRFSTLEICNILQVPAPVVLAGLEQLIEPVEQYHPSGIGALIGEIDRPIRRSVTWRSASSI